MHSELFAEIPNVLSVREPVVYMWSGQYLALQTLLSSLPNTWTT